MMSETAANIESVEGAGQRHRVGGRAAQPRPDRDLGGHHEAETESEHTFIRWQSNKCCPSLVNFGCCSSRPLLPHLLRSPSFCANIVKKDPGRARQNSLATAGTNFTKPGAQNKGDICSSKLYDHTS